ncbi:MAG: sensor histidine kinase [Dehalococcoidia bacterium]
MAAPARQSDYQRPRSPSGGGPPAGGWSLLDVAGRLAHDIRNPLTSLEVTAFVLASELKGLERRDLDGLVAEIFEVRHRVTLGVDELVESARVADGDIDVSRDWTRLGDVVDEALRDAGYYRAGSVVYRESPDRSDLLAFVDGARMRMVVRSLMRYLLDYGRAPVRVRVRPGEDTVVLRIEDASTDVTAADVETTMSRLEAGPSLGEAFGAGLGLFVCRPIVEAHGGSLTGEVGDVGSTAFVIRLPRGENLED